MNSLGAGPAIAQTFSFKFGTGGSGDGRFLAPQGIAVDSSSNIFVADINNNCIQVLRFRVWV
jgi:hypothetical protein